MTLDVQARTGERAAPPVSGGRRILAPDLARGAMLLLIALANATGVFLASTPGVDPTPHGPERVWNVFLFLFVHARALPLFALMFGYGLVQFARHQDEAGRPPGKVRALLLRRNAWLFAFGLAHGVLLYSGDVLGAYGLIGIAFTVLLLRRGDRVHRLAPGYLILAALYVLGLAALVLHGLAAGSGGGAGVPTSDFPSVTEPSYGASLAARVGEWPATVLSMLPMILFIWIGAWAARRRLLDEPAKHRRLLRRGATVGLTVAVLGGLPMGLLAGGFLHADADTAGYAKMLYETAGFFGGIGYGCLFGLLALRVSSWSAASRRQLPVTALAALGRRSLSGYLVQSVAWLVLASPYALALGDRLGSPTFVAAGSALLVWLGTLVGAYLMHRRARRGPAEILLRRLAYGRRG
ncbi:DUF418 domain-containing protein [Micromonospora musae]|uniref:DUF418 domain-containing protein n=1 Tax=Micromonospora musae TaxID=1894970 RepID=A0ABX9QZM7_9ACTN|nr:DUF418 domain-containing protein [Micromonospora musae]RKN16155.1 DUF418 domain-containing protein [Micromonospora musae]